MIVIKLEIALPGASGGPCGLRRGQEGCRLDSAGEGRRACLFPGLPFASCFPAPSLPYSADSGGSFQQQPEILACSSSGIRRTSSQCMATGPLLQNAFSFNIPTSSLVPLVFRLVLLPSVTPTTMPECALSFQSFNTQLAIHRKLGFLLLLLFLPPSPFSLSPSF